MRRASPSCWPVLAALLLWAGGCAHAPAAPGGAAALGRARPGRPGAGGRARAAGEARAAGGAAGAGAGLGRSTATPLPAPPVRVTPLSADAVSALLRREHAPPPRPGHGDDADRPARLTMGTALARLTRVLGSLRAARDRGRHRPPAVVVSEWSRLLGRLDDYLDQPPSETPAPELARTRIVVETELRHDARAWRLPSSLVARVRSRLAYLDHRLRTDGLVVPAVAPRHIEWPIDPVVINSPFGLRTDPIDGKIRFHDGLDLNGQMGQAVTAAADGVVVWAGWRGGYGRHIEIAHGGGWMTTYSHLSRILVHRGDKVEMGDLIGLVGSTGRSTGPHLHFEILHHGHVLDPTSVLGDPIYAHQNPGTGLGGE